MLSRLRQTAFGSLLAVTTLATVVWPSAALLFHDGTDDPDCSVVIVVHDHAAHRFAGPRSSPPPPDHCVLCHWHSLRTLQSAFRVQAPATASQALASLDHVRLAVVNATGQPARAPPLV